MSDPAHPVPFIPYTDVGRTEQEYMVADQRYYTRRPDVLVYQTDPLEEDVTMAGPVSPKLRVSTSGTDSDFVVKLIDVYPNDYPEPEAAPNGDASDGCSAADRTDGRLPAAGPRRADPRRNSATVGRSPRR